MGGLLLAQAGKADPVTARVYVLFYNRLYGGDWTSVRSIADRFRLRKALCEAHSNRSTNHGGSILHDDCLPSLTIIIPCMQFQIIQHDECMAA